MKSGFLIYCVLRRNTKQTFNNRDHVKKFQLLFALNGRLIKWQIELAYLERSLVDQQFVIKNGLENCKILIF